MSKINYPDFVKFVHAQPKDKKINHQEGWCGCSVGEFYHKTYKKKFGEYNEKVQLRLEAFVHSDEFPSEVYYKLVRPSVAQANYPTYGDLQKLVK